MDVNTAFIIAKREDGSFFATTNLSTELNIKREAETLDIKYGCNDILTLLENHDLANLIVTKLASNSQSESERTASSIRQVLEDKGIL
jgi:hypothetical protein